MKITIETVADGVYWCFPLTLREFIPIKSDPNRLTLIQVFTFCKQFAITTVARKLFQFFVRSNLALLGLQQSYNYGTVEKDSFLQLLQ